MTSKNHPQHAAIRPDWLALVEEEVIRSDLPVIDCHHHLFQRGEQTYLLDAMLADTASGHEVLATIYVQGRAMTRIRGPELMRPVGETEFANGIAAMSASGLYGQTRLCAGIVGFADLWAGDAIAPVLDAHISAAGGLTRQGGRFCGIRQTLVCDADVSLMNPAYRVTPDMVEASEFLGGFDALAARGLSFDLWGYFHQLSGLARLVDRYPDTQFVLDHCGGIVGVGQYAGRHDEVFETWSRNIADIAQRPNVAVKLGGLGMRLSGFGFEKGARPPTSTEAAAVWAPYILRCIDLFTPARAMFETNFPVDKSGLSYRVCWNAFKRLTAGFGEDELQDLFWRSACNCYGLDVSDCRPGRMP